MLKALCQSLQVLSMHMFNESFKKQNIESLKPLNLGLLKNLINMESQSKRKDTAKQTKSISNIQMKSFSSGQKKVVELGGKDFLIVFIGQMNVVGGLNLMKSQREK